MTELSSNLKVFLARELERQFTSIDNSVMMFISNFDDSGSSSESLDNEIATRRQIQSAKRLKENSVALMIPRVDWTPGTIYQKLDSTLERKDLNFYVHTSEGNVYVCLENGGGRPSIDEPTGTGTDPIFLQNGYTWKFMFKVPTTLFDFLDEDWIPLRELPVYEGKPFAYADEQQLQYSVQYNAQGGSIESIGISFVGDAYLNSVNAALEHTAVTSTSNTIVLDGRSSNVDDAYNEYSIRIINGTGAGQLRKITDYTAIGKVATVSTNWDVAPNNTSVYEIIPTIEITGDGTAARAYPKMDVFQNGLISSIVLIDKGSSYTTASVRVLPENSNEAQRSVLIPNISPIDGVGRDPIFDLIAKRLSVLVEFNGTENGKAILGNEYSQYGLWLSPKNALGYNNAGEIAGIDGYLETVVDIYPTSGALPSNWADAAENHYVFGTSSYNSGKVVSFSKTNDTNGQLTLTGLNSPLRRNESIQVFKPSGGGTYEFTGNEAKVRNTLFADSVRAASQTTYRCTHKLSVNWPDGPFNESAPQANIPFDSAVTGSCGSIGIVAGFDNTSGSTTDIFITKVIRGSTADAVGFTGGETLTAGLAGTELTVTEVSGPELNLYSGYMLYISSVDQVTRNQEQTDLFKINFDF